MCDIDVVPAAREIVSAVGGGICAEDVTAETVPGCGVGAPDRSVMAECRSRAEKGPLRMVPSRSLAPVAVVAVEPNWMVLYSYPADKPK